MEERDSVLNYIVSNMKLLNMKTPDETNEKAYDQAVFECFSTCFDSIMKEQKSRHEALGSMQQLQAEIQGLNGKLEEKTGQIMELTGEVSRLREVISMNNSKFQQEKEKIVQERDLAKKEAASQASSCRQQYHEMKNKENAYNKLQEHLRKTLSEKDLPYKNAFETSTPLQKQRVNLADFKASEEYIYFIKQGYHSSMKSSSDLISLLSKCLNDTYSSIGSFISQIDRTVNWGPLPLENPEILKTEVENRLSFFMAAAKSVKKIEEDSDFPQETVPVLKHLLSSYKEICDSNIFCLLKS